MKTTTIGRIGAIVTGAAMLGTAVASALTGAVAMDTLEKGFFFDSNMNPQVQVVVGEKAAGADGAAAGQIAAMIGNMAFTTVSQTASGGTAEAEAQTVPCTAGDIECAAGSANAQGQVTLSWDSIGLVGELQQKEMDCDIYSDVMFMDGMDNGGDSGTFCEGLDWEGPNSDDNNTEVYVPGDTVGTTLIGACETGIGVDREILSSGEFTNEVCTICYNYCDIAMGCEPHLMSEWVELSCDLMELSYDCDAEALVLDAQDDAIKYNVFTDDILTDDIEDSDGDLVGQSYLGKIILGQNEYYVEDVDEDQITIVCGDTGTATTSVPMEYTAPAEGSACDAGDSDQAYSLKLVGAQTIEEKGVVDVTLEVTKPDGTTEQVVSGISGTPIVGDLKVKLQKGSAASNVITGEQSFSADLLVWYVPSEYTFEDGETYTEEGVYEKHGMWEVNFNGGDPLQVDDLEALEDGEYLSGTYTLPEDIPENDQYSSCYDDAEDQTTDIVRYIEFNLQRGDDTELPEGEMIQLPFNDGMYLLSNLKFGYQGLMNENFLPDEMIDTTAISIDVNDINLYNVSDDFNLYREVTVEYVDQWGDSQSEVRLDEGPFSEGDQVLICDTLYQIDAIMYNESDEAALIEYSVKDGSDWTQYEGESGVDSCGSHCGLVISSTTPSSWENSSVKSLVHGETINMTPGWITTNGADQDTSTWIIRNLSETDEDDWELWIDKDEDGVFSIAETCDSPACECLADSSVQTEFENSVWFCAYDDVITIEGKDDTGAEDAIIIELNTTDSDAPVVNITTGDTCTACDDLDSDCNNYATGDTDGTLISLSGAIIEIDGEEIEEPEDADGTDAITGVTVTIPEDELRPTIFFGVESSLNATEITITDADEGTIVNIGGIDVTVEEFGVTGSVSGGGAISGGETTVVCPAQSVSCDDVSYTSEEAVDIGYQLVVVEGSQNSAKNLVLMGGPSVNGLTKDLVSVDDVCAEPVVKMSGTKTLIVAGCEAAQTQQAADALMAELEKLLA
jgi:hypothetical protein